MARPTKAAEEKREARINLSFTTELKTQLEDIASIDNSSVNALIEKICLAYVKRRESDLDELRSLRSRIREKHNVDDFEPVEE